MFGLRYREVFVCFFAGLLLTTAFAPFYFFPVAAVIAGFMLTIWFGQDPRRAAYLGYVFGLGYFGSSIYWVYFSLHDYGGADSWFAVLATVLLVALLALYCAALAWSSAYFSRRLSILFFCLFFYPSLWVVFEYLRSIFLTGFPWNLLGQSLVDSPFFGILPVFGVFGASGLLVLVGAWLWYLWHRRQMKPVMSAVSLVLMLCLVWAAGLIEWTQPDGDAVTVGIVQSNIPQGVKFDPEKMRDIIRVHRELTERMTNVDIAVWSETAIPAYYHQLEERLLLPLWQKFKESGGKHLILGAFVKDQQTGVAYNSIVNVGEPPQVYRKRHLVPFGEYVPLRSLLSVFSRYIMIPMSDLYAGEASPVLKIGDRQVGVSICYEAAFGREIIDALPESDYLINVSNDSWFGYSLAPHQHLQIARVRASEAARDMIRATSTGISAVIAYRGTILARSDQFKQQILTSSIQPRKGLTPYARWHDWGFMTLVIILLMIGLIKSLRHQR